MRLALLALALAVPAAAQPTVLSTPESREAVSLTIYNGGFGVVREVRAIPLRAGVQAVRFEGVPAQIEAQSLSLVSLTRPGGIAVLEQNYQYNLIGTQSVLDAAVGRRIRITRTAGDQTVTESGTLISQPGQGRIVRLDDGRVLVDPVGTIELEALPDGLLSRPSLLWQLDADAAGPQRVEARYLTGGLTWQADYVAVIAADETRADLTGWVTLGNQSGATYDNATLQLVAGDVRRVEPDLQIRGGRMREMAVYDAAPAAMPQQEAFFEYHLYSFPNPTTLAARETKQMQLLAAPGAGVRRRLIVDAGGSYFSFWRAPRPGATGEERSAAVMLELTNSEANGMGMPLPGGTVRVYKADSRGQLQFVGEDRIQHTARNEMVRLYLGDAFDVVSTRRVVEERQVSRREREITVEVEVRNRKETATEVDVVERQFWGDWRITQSSHPHERLDARTAQFSLRLGPDETATVRYTARLQ